MKYIIFIIFSLLTNDVFSNDGGTLHPLVVKDYELFVLKEKSSSFVKLHVYNRSEKNIKLEVNNFIFSFDKGIEKHNRVFRTDSLAIIHGGCGSDVPPLWSLLEITDGEFIVDSGEESILIVSLVEYVNQAFFNCGNEMQLDIYIIGGGEVVLKFYAPLSREKIKFCNDCVYGNKNAITLNCRSCMPRCRIPDDHKAAC